MRHEGDHYRNRLTHTLEGAQIARTAARALRLNEDLAEAVALAHDLGHTPFGHAGERALAAEMQGAGGFDHNRQSLRVVDLLEQRYADFRGLNLTSETREGILKHGADWPHPVALPELAAQRSLEAQIADLADEIAYVNHDLDDGLRSELLQPGMLTELACWQRAEEHVDRVAPHASGNVRRSQILVALINDLVTDLVSTTAARIDDATPDSLHALRHHPTPYAGFSEEREREKLELKRFLMTELYQHPQVRGMTNLAEQMVGELFRCLVRDPGLLPLRVRARFGREGAERAIADHVACMTDRYAEAEHEKLCGGGRLASHGAAGSLRHA